MKSPGKKVLGARGKIRSQGAVMFAEKLMGTYRGIIPSGKTRPSTLAKRECANPDRKVRAYYVLVFHPRR